MTAGQIALAAIGAFLLGAISGGYCSYFVIKTSVMRLVHSKRGRGIIADFLEKHVVTQD